MTRRVNVEKNYVIEGIDLMRLQAMVYRLNDGSKLDPDQRRDLAQRMQLMIDRMVEL